jgi:hypothetical protein
MNLQGTISMTEDWAEFDIDPMQAIAGYVVLMLTPLGENPTDVQCVDAAYAYFNGENGNHFSLDGQLQGHGPIHFFLVTQVVKG